MAAAAAAAAYLLLGRRVRAPGELLARAGEPGVQRHVPHRGRAGGGRGGAEPDGERGGAADDGVGSGGARGAEAGRQGGAGEAQRGARLHDAVRLHGLALRPGRADEAQGGRHAGRRRRGQAPQEGAQHGPRQEVLLRRHPLLRRHEEPLLAPLTARPAGEEDDGGGGSSSDPILARVYIAEAQHAVRNVPTSDVLLDIFY
jgi:hypothetical protein